MIGDLWRGRWLLGLAAGLAAGGELLLRFGGGGPTTLVSLLDVALLLAPLTGLVVGTLQVHDGRELTELLLAQPVSRARIFRNRFLGLVLPLVAALTLGLLAPPLWHGLLTGPSAAGYLRLAGGAAVLTLISAAVAFTLGTVIDDRVRALGMALALWLGGTVLWDGLLLFLAVAFGDRPIEGTLVVLLALNPYDLVRVALLLGSEGDAMLGQTGAALQQGLGTGGGRLLLGALVTGWVLGPCLLARRVFTRKDF